MTRRADMNERLHDQPRNQPDEKKDGLRAAQRKAFAIPKIKGKSPDPGNDCKSVPYHQPVDLFQPGKNGRAEYDRLGLRLVDRVVRHDFPERVHAAHCHYESAYPDCRNGAEYTSR